MNSREVIVKVRFVGNPELPSITAEEIQRTLFRMELEHNTSSIRRVHVTQLTK